MNLCDKLLNKHLKMYHGIAILIAVLALSTVDTKPHRTEIFKWQSQSISHYKMSPVEEDSLRSRMGFDDDDSVLSKRSAERENAERNRGGRVRFDIAGTRGKRSKEQSDIVFPGPKSGDNLFKLPAMDGNPSCTARSFCVNVDEYPADYIDKVLQNKASEYQDIFGEDQLAIDISQRIDTPNEKDLCASVDQIVFPQFALTLENEWKFVINQKNYKQGVRVELCENDNQTCEFAPSLPNGFKVMCKQKYIYRRLLALDKNGTTVLDIFKLPSCCSCVYTEFSDRFGLSTRKGFSSGSSFGTDDKN